MNTLTLHCINCGSDRVRLALKGTVSLKDALTSGPYLITDANSGKFEDIYVCAQCGLHFVDRLKIKQELQEYYRNQMLDSDYLADEKGRRKTAGRIVGMLEKLAGPSQSRGRKLLDVGCGPGIFISEAERRGWAVSGIDLSPKNIDFAARHFHLSSVSAGSAEEIEARFGESEFDVITAFDVIEHLYDPKAITAVLYRKLRPGGILVMTVPLIDSPLARVMGTRWHALVPSHLNYFTAPSSRHFYEALGFTPAYRRHYVRYLSLEYLLRRLTGKTHLRIPAWLNVVLPVNLFDEAEVYLKKQ